MIKTLLIAGDAALHDHDEDSEEDSETDNWIDEQGQDQTIPTDMPDEWADDSEESTKKKRAKKGGKPGDKMVLSKGKGKSTGNCVTPKEVLLALTDLSIEARLHEHGAQGHMDDGADPAQFTL